jgi:hypothetical protein
LVVEQLTRVNPTTELLIALALALVVVQVQVLACIVRSTALGGSGLRATGLASTDLGADLGATDFPLPGLDFLRSSDCLSAFG